MSDNLFQNVKMVSQPVGLKVKLFPHQLSSIYKMEQLETNNIIDSDSENCFKQTKIAINADLTGFGKTLAMIGLMVRDKMEWDLDVPHIQENIISESTGLIKTYITNRYDKLPTNLVLVSQSIIGQWEKELQKSNLKYSVVISNKDVEKLNVEDNDVVLVSPSFYNKIIAMNSMFAWKRFIFDEPGNLRIAGMSHIKAGFYWFITATPLAIYNNHKNCKWSFMRDLFCSNINSSFDIFIKDITIKNDQEFVRQSFQMPPTHHIYHECHQPIYNAISIFVNSTIQRMIEAGNIEGAITALGGSKTSNIIELIKSNKEKELFQVDLKLCAFELSDRRRLELNEQRDQLLNQIEMINERFQNMLNENCIICCENFTNPVIETNCQNIFCGECLLTWLQRKDTCPMCRVHVDPSKLIYIETEESKTNCVVNIPQQPKFQTKVECVINIIKNNPTGKFLIFSEYDSTFYPMCNELIEQNILFVEIKGNVKSREKKLELFKSGRIQVLFLNSNFNGAGINLTEATDIILCHRMSGNTETQIIGRANRIGRTIPLNVHHLLVNNNNNNS